MPTFSAQQCTFLFDTADKWVMGNFSTPPPSLPLSLVLAYTGAVVFVRLDFALERIRAAVARVMN